MTDQSRFNLEAAIGSWRRFVLSKKTISVDDAEELESHLRDEIDQLLADGLSPAAAFDAAVEHMGDRQVIEAGYDSVYWKKLRSSGAVVDELQRRGALLGNYAKVAARNLRRKPGFTFINVAGLGIGMACCLLILHFVQYELSYDRHHDKADRIYRVTTHYPQDDRHWAATSPPVGPALHDAVPEIEAVARFVPITSNVLFEREGRHVEHTGGVYADSTAFRVFSIPLVQGRAESALSAPNSIVLSRTLAERIFGEADPVGQTLSANYFDPLTVTAVMEDRPSATHLPFEFMVSMDTFYEREPEWASVRNWERFYTYVLLHASASSTTVAAKLDRFADSFFAGTSGDTPGSAVELQLQPLLDIHLHSQLEREYRPTRDVRYVYLFSAIALFVLLIAGVNFVNLSTARSAERSREVGVRKALGADRGRLVVQFLGESLLLSALAVVLAGLLCLAGLPLFNQLAGTAFALTSLITPARAAGFVAIGLAAGLASGFYPAMVLSSFQPTQVLYGSASTPGRSTGLRKGLVIFQFAVSIFLLIAVAVMYRQFEFVHDKPLGFDRERVVAVRLNPGDYREAIHSSPETFKQELKRHPAVEEISLASSYPGACCNVEPVRLKGSADPDPVNLRIGWGVDHDFIEALGISLAEGRDFSERAPTDTAGWLINQAAARQLGAENPIGRVLTWRAYEAPIVGIVENYHFTSLHHAVEPLALPLRPAFGHLLLVRIQGEQSSAVLRHIEQQLRLLGDDQPFRHAFLDDEFRQLYEAEDQLRDIVTVFSILAILIACLGLYGLAAFTAQQRTKEIGIRKVLGARVSGIAVLLAGDFLKLVAVAFVVAAPVAFVVMRRWLETFAYQVEISLAVFIIAGGAALIIALATVSYQAMRVALADPVSSLRYE